MNWSILTIVLLVVYIVFLFLFFIFRFKNKRLVAQLISFGAIVLALNTFTLLIPYLYETTLNGGSIVLSEFWINLAASLAGSISLFTFNYATDALIAFGTAYPLFSAVYVLAILDVILITVATVISFFNSSFINSLRVSKALKKDNCEIILNYKEQYLPYYKKSKNCVVWVDENISDEELLALVNEKIIVLKNKFNLATLKSNLFNTTSRYDFILFNEDNILETLNVFEAALEEGRTNFYLHADATYEHNETLIKQIIDPNNLNANIFLYSKEELLARQFVMNNPYTKFLPDGFVLENSLLREDVKINVFVLGFDLVNQEVIRASMFTNQFVSKIKTKLKPNLVNYYIFDETATEDNSNFITDYQLRYSKMSRNKSKYIDLCEEVANITFIPFKQTSSKTFEKIQTLISNKENEFNLFFVSGVDDYESINLSNKINSLYKNSSHHIFVRVGDFNLVNIENNENIFTYYGDFTKLMTPQVIIDKDLLSLAQYYAYAYNDYSRSERKKLWPSLKFIDMYSNIALAISTRFKLNLLGYDYVRNDELKEEHVAVSEEEFMAKYLDNAKEIDLDINNYSKPTTRNYLLYQEHLRWNAFHLLNGYETMEKDDIIFDGKKIVRKDYNLKLHGCIISYEGLLKLAKHQQNVINNHPRGRANNLEDLYCFDGLVFTTVYKAFRELAYTIIKK